MKELISTLFLVTLASANDPPETCERSWKKIGCFHDRVFPDRPYMNELVNHRDPTNPAWDGHTQNWRDFPASLKALACQCANLTRARNHLYFGLQFFGECWTGPGANFARDGPSTECVGPDFRPCDNTAETECVGRQFTNYIYYLGDESKSDKKVPGGWSEWSSWTECSSKCGGGRMSRERQCNNPVPKNGGAECPGEPEEDVECNTEPCEPICKRHLEIGVIMDASSSVTSANYDRMKSFVVQLTEEFVVSPTEVHFGVIHYSWKAYLDFKISDRRYWYPAALKKKIMEIKYTYGGTRTDLALKMAEDEFFCSSCGIRPGVPKVLVVITDGKSSLESVSMTEATAKLKASGVVIISIGVGSAIDENELRTMAHSEDHVFMLTGFTYLKDKLNQILKLACKAQLSPASG